MQSPIKSAGRIWQIIVATGIVAAAGATATAVGGGWVKDASRAPFPAQPVRGSVYGKPVQLKHALINSNGTTTVDQFKFNQVTLYLRSSKSLFSDTEVRVIFLVKQGQKPDGKTFVRLPPRPGASSGFDALRPVELVPGLSGTKLPLLQDVSLTGETGGGAQTMTDMQGEPRPTMRLQFGKRRGSILPGKIYLCWTDKQKSYVAGAFEAVIESDSYKAPAG